MLYATFKTQAGRRRGVPSLGGGGICAWICASWRGWVHVPRPGAAGSAKRQGRPLGDRHAQDRKSGLSKDGFVGFSFDREQSVSQVLNENARKPLSIGYLAFSLCSDILTALSVF